MAKPIFYTYAYLRKKDNTPYYIGKGQKDRAFRKHKGISVPKDRSRVIFLKQNLTEEEAFKHEKYMIAVFGRKDLGTGILLNKTDGGEGVSGHIITEEQREKYRENGRSIYEQRIGIHSLTNGERIEISKRGGKTSYERGVGIHALSAEKKSKMGIKSGKSNYEKGIGIHSWSKKQFSENGKKSGKVCYEKGVGIHGLTKEERIKNSKKAGKVTYEKGVGVHARSKEKMSEDGRKGGKAVSALKWKCTETGYISHAAGLTLYQNKRGIDTSKRIKVDGPIAWEITFEDGRAVVITIPLRAWAEENRYSYDCILKVRCGSTKKHRDIIKIVLL